MGSPCLLGSTPSPAWGIFSTAWPSWGCVPPSRTIGLGLGICWAFCISGVGIGSVFTGFSFLAFTVGSGTTSSTAGAPATTCSAAGAPATTCSTACFSFLPLVLSASIASSSGVNNVPLPLTTGSFSSTSVSASGGITPASGGATSGVGVGVGVGGAAILLPTFAPPPIRAPITAPLNAESGTPSSSGLFVA